MDERKGKKVLELGSGCVAQLVERLFPIPEVRGFESSHRQKFIYIELCFEKTKIDKKRPGMVHF